MGLESLLLIFVVFIVFMFFQSRQMKKRQQEQQQTRDERLAPGVWVMTTAGFYGRFVDRDGQVVILETADGVETYWDQRAVRDVLDELPFDTAQPVDTTQPVDEGEAGVIDVEAPAEDPLRENTDQAGKAGEN
ncbi:preprotein translocase subunit YajC [Nanchangia anserum]|uniref:Preprotein translocase subunit YajC n=1 Tax=Nanchangia anserum TaxID=2692125 RepID=A0A8I0G6M4_9ACTO|nr:preprotein translocase subunit YajC [Nanchangia anserum]MBD3688755.1 preprotein translocase subunit YajC [Nanchangia anserum]